MIIQLDIPDSLPEGRRSSFKKGIIDALTTSLSDFTQRLHSATSLEHTPKKHEAYRAQGETVGRQLVTLISNSYPR